VTMASWDPVKSPYPWLRGSVIPASGRPCWDLPRLLSIQQPNLTDSINR
jgi:hypothetical protein